MRTPVHSRGNMTVVSDRVTEITQILRSCLLLSCLAPSDLARIAAEARIFTMAPGPLFLEGDRGDCAYVLVHGRMDISVYSPDGREMLLYRVPAQEVFGEMALLDEGPRSASAIARTPCRLVTIPRATFYSLLQENPQLALRIIVTLSHRLRIADQTIKAVSFLDMPCRLAQLLLHLDAEHGRVGCVPVSQVELATFLGCARQSVTRVLANWRHAGFVDTSRKHITILDRAALQTYLPPEGMAS